MSSSVSETMSLTNFRNEPCIDFTVPENRSRMEEALAKVRSQFGKEYPIRLGGETITSSKP